VRASGLARGPKYRSTDIGFVHFFHGSTVYKWSFKAAEYEHNRLRIVLIMHIRSVGSGVTGVGDTRAGKLVVSALYLKN